MVLEDYSEGNLVCQKCGRVIGDRVIATDSEWRTFADGDSSKRDDPNRVGGPESELMKEFGLSTRIASDSSGLARFHNSESMEHQQRALMDEFSEVRRLTERCGMPDGVTGRAQALYKGLKLCTELRGAKKLVLCGVSVFIAGREKNVPRPLKEIAQTQGIDKRELSRFYNKIRKLSKDNPNIKLLVQKNGIYKQNEKEMISRFCSELGLKMPIAVLAKEIIQRIHKLNELAGRQPTTLAGVAVFLSCRKLGILIEIEKIASVVGVATATIQTAVNKLERVMNQILDDAPTPVSPAAVAASSSTPTLPLPAGEGVLDLVASSLPSDSIFGEMREFV